MSPADSNPDTTSPWEYPWEEWDEAMGSGATDNPTEAANWFERRYSDPEEAAWKLARFARACSYREMHRGQFGEFELRAPMPDGTVRWSYSHHLMGALYRWFSHAPDHVLSFHAPVEEIMAMAHESAARR